MTDAATNIVHPWAVELATDDEVITEIGGSVEHVTFFGEDPWVYGLTSENTHALETMIEYATNQELIPEAYDVEDLFATEHLQTGRFG